MTLLALVCFSLGSFLGKVASFKDISYRVYFFEGVGTLTVFTTFVVWNRNAIFNNFSVNYPALLMGLSWGIGTILLLSHQIRETRYCPAVRGLSGVDSHTGAYIPWGEARPREVAGGRLPSSAALAK
jgi:hypothetical protein